MHQPTQLRASILIFLLVAVLAGPAFAENPPAKKFPNGLPTADDYFPIAVWLQEPRDAEKYKAIGVNLYIGLWEGPTEEQLKVLEKAGMPVICDQSPASLKFIDRKIIVGWMHGDEPDNAQEIPGGKGYGPPITPEKIETEYKQMKKADPSRPVILNLGQGVAWDGWIGRGVRTNHPEDYAEYIKGADLVSFDIYPVTAAAKDTDVAGKLWTVPFGVERLVKWTGNEKPVWNCIETTHIGNPDVKPTVAQVKSEIWMSIIAGSRGLIYFCHEFKPTENDHALLSDKQMAEGVKEINAQIKSLAKVINAEPAKVSAKIEPADAKIPISSMTRRHDGATYVFSVAMRPGDTEATFTLPKSGNTVEVIGEDRKITAKGGVWKDEFKDYGVHLYKIKD